MADYTQLYDIIKQNEKVDLHTKLIYDNNLIHIDYLLNIKIYPTINNIITSIKYNKLDIFKLYVSYPEILDDDKKFIIFKKIISNNHYTLDYLLLFDHIIDYHDYINYIDQNIAYIHKDYLLHIFSKIDKSSINSIFINIIYHIRITRLEKILELNILDKAIINRGVIYYEKYNIRIIPLFWIIHSTIKHRNAYHISVKLLLKYDADIHKKNYIHDNSGCIIYIQQNMINISEDDIYLSPYELVKKYNHTSYIKLLEKYDKLLDTKDPGYN